MSHKRRCAVNCDWRYVFCNTLGIIPFSWTSDAESEATHQAVVDAFRLRSITRIWLGLPNRL